jgi:hypothetical protein
LCRRGDLRGAVLVMAMIVVMIGSLAMTGSIMLLHARTQYTEQHLSSIQRRIAESNARAFTREYLLENVIPRGARPSSLPGLRLR